MHSFLKAIGFHDSFESERELELLLDNLFQTYDQRTVIRAEHEKKTFLELSKSFGPSMGIRLCGEMDETGFHRLYYYPYLLGSGVTTQEELSIDQKVDGSGYIAMADEGRIGVSLIFYVQNPGEYLRQNAGDHLRSARMTTTLSGLASSGTILLPAKNNNEEKKDSLNAYYQHHDSLITAARNGSQDAIESLTMEDMDAYAMVTRRIQNEDIYSIVDTLFMPYGMESDMYQIIGQILFFTKARNAITKECVYQMTLECNGLTFDICINETDLLGIPDVGRRFKGNIWLQGRINFD